MDFLVTDSEANDWFGRNWTVKTTHQTENKNHRPQTYPDPLVAILLQPAFENYPSIRIFKTEGQKPESDGLRTTWNTLTSLEELPQNTTDPIKITTFGIVCAVNAVTQEDFLQWALDWLANKDRTPEYAQKTKEKLAEYMLEKLPEISLGAAHAALASVILDSTLYSACAAHRAWIDSPDIKLPEIATITNTIPPENIASILKGN